MTREYPKNSEPKNEVALPTIGRLVYFYGYLGDAERAAIVADVVGGHTVNLTIIERNGTTGAAANIPHADDIPDQSIHRPHWDWMPYQKGQAKKTEELEAQIEQTQKLLKAAPL